MISFQHAKGTQIKDHHGWMKISLLQLSKAGLAKTLSAFEAYTHTNNKTLKDSLACASTTQRVAESANPATVLHTPDCTPCVAGSRLMMQLI